MYTDRFRQEVFDLEIGEKVDQTYCMVPDPLNEGDWLKEIARARTDGATYRHKVAGGRLIVRCVAG